MNPIDTEPYQVSNIPLFEAIYGKNLISLGGTAAINNMFRDLPIKGLKALDLGFGLGGVAFYLAENYQMQVSGIELHPWMVEHARKNMPEQLRSKLEFNTYDDQAQMPYKPETFDLVYSKGVLNHIADKEPLFRQINTVLKPRGLFVIADWIFPQAEKTGTGPLVSETQESYERVLTHAGFHEIEFRDDGSAFLSYAKEILQNLSKQRDFIERSYNAELFSTLWNQHETLINKINQRQQIAVRISARKK